MIPKIIHYCWFGGNPLPESAKKCIDSWKKYCPNYEIREWNETNYDLSSNHYMEEAYSRKIWGFVPDYARLDIVYQHGGIYMDVDVEVVRSMDELLNNAFYMGIEKSASGSISVNPGLGFGAEKHDPGIYKLMHEIYDNLSFINQDGTVNKTPSPIMNTEYLETLGFKREDREQTVEGIHIYQSECFCPKNFETAEIHCTDKTYSIHHFDASWYTSHEKKWHVMRQKLAQKIGFEKSNFVFELLPIRLVGRIYKSGWKEAWKRAKKHF